MRSNGIRLAVCAALLAFVVVPGGALMAQVTDQLVIGSVITATGTGTVTVPVYIQDNPGTTLNNSNVQGLRISGISFQALFDSPGGCVAMDFNDPSSGFIPFDRHTGILPPPTQFVVQGNGLDGSNFGHTDIAVVYQKTDSNVSTPPIPFTGGLDKIGDLVFTLSGCSPGTVINITFVTTGAAQATLTGTNTSTGTVTPENITNGQLSVTNGSITIGIVATPTVTGTPVSTATNTPVATVTNTPVSTATNTPVSTATNTPVATVTNTPVLTATNTPIVTATNTPIAPTATSTPVVATATSTPIVATPTRTNTPAVAVPTSIPTLDGRALAALAVLLGAIGLLLTKRVIR